jgi:hypothetical protein
VVSLTPSYSGKGKFRLVLHQRVSGRDFREEVFNLQTIKRCEYFMLALVEGTDRFAIFCYLTDSWLEKNFELSVEVIDRSAEPVLEPLPALDLKEVFGPTGIDVFSKVHWSAEALRKHELPNIGYPVPSAALKHAASGDIGIGPEELFYWLQLYTEMDCVFWSDHLSAMETLAKTISSATGRGAMVIESETFWLELGPVDLKAGDIVTVQRSGLLLGAFEKVSENKLRFAAFHALDGNAIRWVLALARKPGLYDYDRVDPTKWESACHYSTKISQAYASKAGRAYISRWEFGLGISSDGSEVRDWFVQRNTPMLDPQSVAVQIDTYRKFQSLIEQ